MTTTMKTNKLPLKFSSPPKSPRDIRQRATFLRDMIMLHRWRWHPPVVADLERHIVRLRYNQALTCVYWRLERVSLLQGHAQYLLFYRDKLFGVVDVRTEKRRREACRMLALYLYVMGWHTHYIIQSEAQTLPEENLARAERLFYLAPPKRKRNRKKVKVA